MEEEAKSEENVHQVGETLTQGKLHEIFDKAVNLARMDELQLGKQQENYQMNYITPQKNKLEGSCFESGKSQATKPKAKKELSTDRYSTPPKRPTIPSHEQLEQDLKDERRRNRRK